MAAVFTLPASEFPAIGQNFMVGLPLDSSPATLASEFMVLLETNVMFFLDANGNLLFRIASVDFAGPPPYPSDFEIAGGIGYLITNGKDPVTGADIVYTGDGWCNVFVGTPPPGHVEDCP